MIDKFEASLTDDTRVIIYDRHLFIVQATYLTIQNFWSEPNHTFYKLDHLIFVSKFLKYLRDGLAYIKERKSFTGLAPSPSNMVSTMEFPFWCHDTQYNDTQHNDTQHNDTQNNDTQHINAQHIDTQHIGIQHIHSKDIDIQHIDTQLKDTHHKIKNVILSIMTLSIMELRTK